MTTMTVLDSVGGTQTVEKPLTPGQAARAASRPVTIATEDITALTATQTVSGTVAATQSGTWTVQPGNTANTTAWKVDGSAVTQPISGAVTQGGTWTVQPGNTANTTAWKFVLDASQVVALGQAAMTASQPVVLASDHSDIKTVSGGDEYEAVAASQTDVVLGTTGTTGDYLEGILCVVATAATSQVMIGDGATPAVVIMPNAVGAGVGSYYVPIGARSKTGSWRVTTAAGVSVLAFGDFLT